MVRLFGGGKMKRRSKKPQTDSWAAIREQWSQEIKDLEPFKYMLSQIQKEPYWMDDATVEGFSEQYRDLLASSADFESRLAKIAQVRPLERGGDYPLATAGGPVSSGLSGNPRGLARGEELHDGRRVAHVG
jgi:hypothetical protein